MSSRLRVPSLTHKQKVLALLADGRPHTHHELYALHVIAHSRVSELRADGYLIDCWRDGDDSVYQLLATPFETAPVVEDRGPHLSSLADAGAVSSGVEGPPSPGVAQLSLEVAA